MFQKIEPYNCEFSNQCPFSHYPKSSILPLTGLGFPKCDGVLPDEETVKYFCELHRELFVYAEKNGIRLYRVPVKVPTSPERVSCSMTVINEIVTGLQGITGTGLLTPIQYGEFLSTTSRFASTLSSLWSILKMFETSQMNHRNQYNPDDPEESLRRFLCKEFKGTKKNDIHNYLLKTNGGPLSKVDEDDIRMLLTRFDRLIFALGGQNYFDKLEESLR